MNSPCRDRKFERLEDFPNIYLERFTLNTPLDELFYESEDGQTYLEPSVRTANPKVPSEVLELFERSEVNIVEHNGWLWKRRIYGKNICVYRKFQKFHLDLTRQLQPYISKLESLVGKKVPINYFLPPFVRDSHFTFAFKIPESAYFLEFWENSNNKGKNRGADLNIMSADLNLEHQISIPSLKILITLAHLEYKGRL